MTLRRVASDRAVAVATRATRRVAPTNSLRPEPLAQQGDVLREGDLRLLNVRVPLLLPFDGDPAVVATLLDGGEARLHRDLPLAEQQQIPAGARGVVAPRILDVDMQDAVAEQIEHLVGLFAHAI